MFRRLLVFVTIIAALGATAPAFAQAASACQFVLGFKTLHDLDPADVGECIDNQAFAANGDAQQHTTKGLLAWRKADNWTAFTNGYWTWVNGPSGLAKRLNTERFSFEANPQGLPVVAAGAVAAAPSTAPDLGPLRSASATSAPPLPHSYPNDDPAWSQTEAAKYATIGGVPITLVVYPWSLPGFADETVEVTFDDSDGAGHALLGVAPDAATTALKGLLADAKARWPGRGIDLELAGRPYYAPDPIVDNDWVFQSKDYTVGSGWFTIQTYGRAYSWPDVQQDDVLWRPTAPAAGGTVCADGWVSPSTGRGTCSHHGGEAH